jgi:hypothetical protein
MASYYITETPDRRVLKRQLGADLLTEYKYRYRSSAGLPVAQEEFERRRAAGEPTVLWRIDTMESPAVLVDRCNL